LLVTGLSDFLLNLDGKDSSIAKRVYLIGCPSSSVPISKVPDDFSVPTEKKGVGDILDYNLFLNIISAILMVISCGITGLILVQRIVELFFLFLISPFVVSSMPIDNGKRIML
jgi:hypothetical protein